MIIIYILIGILIGGLFGFLAAAFLKAGRDGEDKSNELMVIHFESVFSSIKTILNKYDNEEFSEKQTIEQIKNLLRK